MRRSMPLLLAVACATEDQPPPSPTEAAFPPGRIALRRLTREEYQRSVRDLLSLPRPLGADLPADPASHGFDTVGDGLTVSPLHVELYEKLAAEAVNLVLDAPLTQPLDRTWQGLELTADAAEQGWSGDALMLFSNGAVSVPLSLPEDGTWRVSAQVWGDQGGEQPVRARLGFALQAASEHDVTATGPDDAQWITHTAVLRRGVHALELVFTNDHFAEGEDRNLAVAALRLEGPIGHIPRENPAFDAVFTCDPDALPPAEARACADEVLGRLARRAWRRPVAQAERDALLGLYDAVLAGGDAPRLGVGYALRAVLTSPYFLLLIEPAAAAGEGPIPVDDHALAARLAVLLWSSLPDEALLDLADQGRLSEPGVLAAQVARMLQDPRASALSEVFAGQWLMINALDAARPDFWTYPGFTEDLRASMRESMIRFFDDLVRTQRPLTDLVQATDAFVDERLALTYGVRHPGPRGAWARVDVGPWGRRGWLTTPGLLTATSYPTRTSPVRRGVWVLGSLLCDEPPPPPANVEGLPDVAGGGATVRERLEAHRNQPQCLGCHQHIDPVGLAFEHFDGVGMWRETEGGLPIDASGGLPDGTQVDGIEDLAAVLATDPRLPRCLVEKLFTYAHGRAPTATDEPHVDAALRRFVDGGLTFEALATAVVGSDTFRFQDVSPEAP